MDFVSNAGSVLGLVALLVAAVAIAYSALTRTTIATLKESNSAYAERISNLDKDIAGLVSDREADRTQIATLTSERDTLARVVTGEAHLVAIEDQLTQHHTDAQVWWTAAAADLKGIREALEGAA